jgi:hypothetical protein
MSTEQYAIDVHKLANLRNPKAIMEGRANNPGLIMILKTGYFTVDMLQYTSR